MPQLRRSSKLLAMPELELKRPAISDVALTGVSFIFLGIFSFATGSMWEISGLATNIAFIAVAAMHGAMLWRMRHPVASALVVYLGAFVHFCTGAFALPSDLLIFVALYSVTVHGPPRARWWALGGALFGALLQGGNIYFTTNPPGVSPDFQSVVSAVMISGFLAGLILAVWAVGIIRRTRLERVETLAERAARLERERDQQVIIATAAERARIAREMHDVVAHSLSIIIAQADGGRYAATNSLQAAQETLGTIAETGRSALTDMRRILGVLRTDQENTNFTPQPDSGDLTNLVRQVRATGLKLSFTSFGTPVPLPTGIGLTVYRIAQEALTNVLKHAGPAAAAIITQQWEPGRLTMTIDDDGRGASTPSDGQGQGLVGMRERAIMVGGSLVSGPKPGGGFRVRVTIPLPTFPVPPHDQGKLET